ncbi:MAG: DUF2723 domain-containing protein, partial [Candidatus Riflebacteria bacterium]|nr:DUF2723 domain-containing protein [Candidatus Riflebacteria bacterium]
MSDPSGPARLTSPAGSPAPPALGRGASKPWAPVLDVVVFGLPLAVFCTTLARGPSWGDSTELTLVAQTLSVAHPTGYPLYVLLAHIATLLPVGEIPFRVGLVSAVPVALAVWVIYRALVLLTESLPISATAALALAFSQELWSQASVPEVYGLHVLLTAAAIWATVRAIGAPTFRRLALLAFILGLSFAHHGMTLFIGSASIVAVLLSPGTRPLFNPGRIAALVGLFVLPLTLYGALWLIAHRPAPIDQGHLSTPMELARHMTGRQFSYRMFSQPGGSWLGHEAKRLVREAASQPCPWKIACLPYLVLVVMGIRRLAGRPPVLALLGVSALADVLYTVGYNIPDKSAYYLNLYVSLAMAGAVGLQDAIRLGAGHGRWSRLAWLLVLVPLVTNFGRSDRAGDTSMADYTKYIVALVPARSLVVTDDIILWWGF